MNWRNPRKHHTALCTNRNIQLVTSWTQCRTLPLKQPTQLKKTISTQYNKKCCTTYEELSDFQPHAFNMVGHCNIQVLLPPNTVTTETKPISDVTNKPTVPYPSVCCQVVVQLQLNKDSLLVSMATKLVLTSFTTTATCLRYLTTYAQCWTVSSASSCTSQRKQSVCCIACITLYCFFGLMCT